MYLQTYNIQPILKKDNQNLFRKTQKMEYMEYKEAGKGWLYILTFAEFWDRFSYYGIQSLLVLYVTKILLFSDTQAYELYGTFTALTFSTTVLGGIIADHLWGIKKSVIFGSLLMITGNILLIIPDVHGMYFGLAALICGIGLFKPNNVSFAGALFKKTGAKREGAFSIFYIGMNAGALLGPLVYGYIAQRFSWLYGFGISATGMLLALIIFMAAKIQLIDEEEHHQRQRLNRKLVLNLSVKQCLYLTVFIILGLFFILLQQAELFGGLLMAIGVITIAGLAVTAVKSDKVERKRIMGLSLLSFFCIFFFACSLQTATTLTLFIEREINRYIFGLHVPTMMFLSLQPFFIILTAPLVARIWNYLERKHIHPSSPTKIAIGLLLAAVSFIIFSLAARQVNPQSHLSLLFIVVGNLLLGLGELCVFPVVLSAISQLAPLKLRSTMMGILFLSLAFSGYLSGLIAQIISIESQNSLSHAVNYSHAFVLVSLMTLAISILLFIFIPKMKYLLQIETL